MATMLLLAVFGTMYAEEVTFNSASDHGTEQKTISKNGITITTTNGYVNATNPEYRFYKSSTTTIRSTVGNITKIEFTCTANGTAKYGPGSWVNEGAGEYTYSGKIGTWIGNAEEVTFNASNNQVRATNIVVTYTPNSSEYVTMSFPKDSYSAKLGETFSAPALTMDPTVSGVSYSSSAPTVATVNETTGEVTLVGSGTTIIKAEFPGSDTYIPNEASYTLTVIDPNATSTTFIFNTEEGLKALGIDVPKSDSDGTPLNEVTSNLVTLKTTHATTPTRVFNSSGKLDLRVYKNGGSLTFSVPDGYIITNIAMTGSAPFDDFTGSENSVTFTASNTMKIETVTVSYSKLFVSVNVGETGYATLYDSNQALTVPEGVTASTYKLNGHALTVSKTYESGDVIPAGEAVVLNANEATYQFAVSTQSGEVDQGNALKGTDSETRLAPDANSYFYMLSLNEHSDLASVGFYWGAPEGAAFTNGAHKAYLKVPKSSGAKFYRFDGQTTAIENVQAAQPDVNAPMYNVAGQRVGKNYKGVVIQNGRKYVVK